MKTFYKYGAKHDVNQISSVIAWDQSKCKFQSTKDSPAMKHQLGDLNARSVSTNEKTLHIRVNLNVQVQFKIWLALACVYSKCCKSHLCINPKKLKQWTDFVWYHECTNLYLYLYKNVLWSVERIRYYSKKGITSIISISVQDVRARYQFCGNSEIHYHINLVPFGEILHMIFILIL